MKCLMKSPFLSTCFLPLPFCRSIRITDSSEVAVLNTLYFDAARNIWHFATKDN